MRKVALSSRASEIDEQGSSSDTAPYGGIGDAEMGSLVDIRYTVPAGQLAAEHSDLLPLNSQPSVVV